MNFGSFQDLLARLDYVASSDSGRPLAILCGSGITVPSVPSVNKIIKSIRDSFQAQDQIDLDVRLQAYKTDAEKYQEAFRFLSLRRPPEQRDRVIALSTLAAYKGTVQERSHTSPADLADFESHIDKWSMPKGVEALGRVWAGLPRPLRGPVITTNFDPLCEVAVRKAGGNVTPLVISDDSTFLGTISAIDHPVVLHIHGYWRESNTLSMNAQLTLERPAVAASIRELLRKYTFLVVGYAGWADVITQEMSLMIKEQRSSELDVLWCSYENEDTFVSQRQADPTFTEIFRAPGNVVFYESVDANVLFPEMEKRLGDKLIHADGRRQVGGRGTLLGWSEITGTTSDIGSPKESALSFFDGRLPAWHDAANHYVPKRDIVPSVVNYLRSCIRKGMSSLTSVLGPAGEGKSTALMQVALELKKSHPDLQVLYQEDTGFGGVQEILALPAAQPYLLVIDDAYGYVERLRQLAQTLNQTGRENVHVLLSCRDSDWRVAGGVSFLWHKHLAYKSFPLRGMSRPDAAAIVQSWESIGPRALGQLTSVPTGEERIAALVQASFDSRFKGEGAFLGALLLTRMGTRLGSHIQDLLDRTSDHAVGENGVTLLEVLATIALPHAAGVYDLNFELLAEAVGILPSTLHADVLPALGEEAALSYSDQRITIRHRLIAELICELSPAAGIDLTRVARQLVGTAVKQSERGGFTPGLMNIAYLSRSLTDHDLSIAAAEAAVTASPNRLTYRTTLAAALRKSGNLLRAVEVGEESLRLIPTAVDGHSARAVFTEWGVAEGLRGNWEANLVLAATALADAHILGALEKSTGASLSCLILALKKLVERDASSIYGRALAAAIWVADRQDDLDYRSAWLHEAKAVAALVSSGVCDESTYKRDLGAAVNRAKSTIEEVLPSSIPIREYKFNELFSLQPSRKLKYAG
ncbi:SIR2 family protein [Pseudarthrobacter oxydans]|uniref:P-loop NTPase n=1 Tax=Pseudarthrobacter oxydans TaxID=1671 RepID=UPI00342E7BEA